MKQLLLLSAALVAFTFTAVAQTSGSVAQTPDTGAQDMSTWSKAAKPPTQKERKKSAAKGAAESGEGVKHAALTGCLAAGQEEGKFTLTTARARKVAVSPDAGVDLKPHVGHQVKLSGTWQKPEPAGDQQTAQRKPDNRNFTAAKVDHLADECKAPATRKERAGP